MSEKKYIHGKDEISRRERQMESEREVRRKIALGKFYDEMKDLKVEHEISAGGDILDATVIE
jgi:hypothetical protein